MKCLEISVAAFLGQSVKEVRPPATCAEKRLVGRTSGGLMQTRDWRQRTVWIADLLKRRTGQDLDAWNARIAAENFVDEASVRAGLDRQGVNGYPQMLLVMERFGYPDFLLASADELIDGQYADRPELRPIL